MKKEMILFLISILLINLVLAEYSCSGTLSTNESLILEGEIKSINGVRVALINSDSRGGADILIDAKKLTLTSEINFTNVSLTGIYHQINLSSIMGSSAVIKLEKGAEGNLELNQITAVEDLQIYVSELSGAYPGDGASLHFIAARGYLFLYNSSRTGILNNSNNYLFELSSAGSAGAIIQVKKCNGGNFIEVVAPEQPPESNNSSINNSLPQNETLSNETLINETKSPANESIPGRNFLHDNLIIILISIAIIVVFAVLMIRYRSYRESKSAVS